MNDKNATISTLRIGTRGSPLALAQAHLVKEKLLKTHPSLLAIDLIVIETKGDQITDRNLTEIGGKGLFTKELEDQLFSGDIDLAVHSMKDVPAILPDGLEIGGLLPREDPGDAFISTTYDTWQNLPEGAIVGTSSPRRATQIQALRPDVSIVPFRGNVNTRLKKLEEGQADATFLAVAGLKRLGFEEHITQVMEYEHMLPSPCQGTIGIECLSNNQAIKELLSSIHDNQTTICTMTERSFLETLGGSCQTPIAGLATIEGDQLYFRAMVADMDSKKQSYAENKAPLSEAVELGKEIALRIKSDLEN